MNKDNETKECAGPMIEAIDLLSEIPAGDFIEDKFTDGVGKCCAIGHLVRLTSDDPTNYTFENCYDQFLHKTYDKQYRFRKASQIALKKMNFPRDHDLSCINNNPSSEYPQIGVKDRVMTFLEDAVEVCNGNEPKNMKR